MKKKIIVSLFSLIIMLSIMFNTKVLALTEESKLEYEGIDVSQWQGYIDYKKVKEAGIGVVYIKSSEGTDFKDPYFETNYENAKRNNLKIGFYHFVRARNTAEAEEEARFFASTIAEKEVDCKLAMDFEVFGGISREEINKVSKRFLEKTKEYTGKEVIVYSDLSNSETTFNNEIASKYSLWLAYYGDYRELNNVNSNWKKYIGVQYSDRGRINGISDLVDRDKYTKEIFLNDKTKLPKIENPKTNSNDTKTVIYTVKRGDSLWKIARKYNTTINEIVKINNIKNPNLIYVGENLKIITNTVYEEKGETNHKIYTIKRGDTLYKIARKYNTTIQNIVELNNIKNPNLIYAGERLRI